MSRFEEISRVFSADELKTIEDALRLLLKCVKESDRESVQDILNLVNGSFWAGKFTEGKA